MVVGNNYTFKSPESIENLDKALKLIRGWRNQGPGVTMSEIAVHLGIERNTAYTYCAELRKRHLVHMKRTGNRVVWRPWADPSPEPAKTVDAQMEPDRGFNPKRQTVSTWPPHHSRDPLVAFLFGEAR